MNRRTLMLVGCLVSTLTGLAHAAGKAPSHLGELYPQRVILANVDKYPSQVKINGKRRNIYGGKALVLKTSRYPFSVEYFSGKQAVGWKKITIRNPGTYTLSYEKGQWYADQPTDNTPYLGTRSTKPENSISITPPFNVTLPPPPAPSKSEPSSADLETSSSNNVERPLNSDAKVDAALGTTTGEALQYPPVLNRMRPADRAALNPTSNQSALGNLPLGVQPQESPSSFNNFNGQAVPPQYTYLGYYHPALYAPYYTLERVATMNADEAAAQREWLRSVVADGSRGKKVGARLRQQIQSGNLSAEQQTYLKTAITQLDKLSAADWRAFQEADQSRNRPSVPARSVVRERTAELYNFHRPGANPGGFLAPRYPGRTLGLEPAGNGFAPGSNPAIPSLMPAGGYGPGFRR